MKINHIAILVKNLDKAREFYGRILGLEELARAQFFISGLWYQLGDIQLHLMLSETCPFPHVHPLAATVQPHFCVSMTALDFDETIKRLKNADIALIGDIEETASGGRRAFFSDYDRNMIEINDEISTLGA